MLDARCVTTKRATAAPTPTRQAIITADDFGLHPAVNAAVEQAHTRGILNTASLMVAAPAAGEAVECARALPGLHVGLHLVLADGHACLAPARIPDLVDTHGRFGRNMVSAGVRFFCLPRVRRQLAAEIRAQFETFAATGLALDHVNAHKHFHLHPTILDLILAIGPEYGLKAMRLPREPRGAMAYTARAGALCLAPWLGRLQRRLARAHIACNDYVFGIDASGHLDEARLLRTLDALPAGVSEIYSHPATRTGVSASMPDYDHPGELAALLSPRVRAVMASRHVQPISFAELGC